MNESFAREEICRVGKSLFARGYLHASAGNISVRLDDGFLITPTDACLGFLDPARLTRLDADGQHVSGDRGSKTIALHTRIYRSTQGFAVPPRCLIHSHSSHCVALTLLPHGSELLAPVTPYFVMKVGHVPVIPYHFPGDPQAAGQVAQAIERYAAHGIELRAVMLARLGPQVWHATPAAAMATLEELEETARLCATAAAPIAPLNAAQIDDLRRVFGAQWRDLT